jgi:anti-sigma B factor antagonist
MSFSTSVERRARAAIVRLEGDLDIASEQQATADLGQALDGADVLVADLRGLSFIDSTGVRVLLTVELLARERRARFGVVRGDGMVARLLEVTRIHQRFPVVDDPEELVEGE